MNALAFKRGAHSMQIMKPVEKSIFFDLPDLPTPAPVFSLQTPPTLDINPLSMLMVAVAAFMGRSALQSAGKYKSDRNRIMTTSTSHPSYLPHQYGDTVSRNISVRV